MLLIFKVLLINSFTIVFHPRRRIWNWLRRIYDWLFLTFPIQIHILIHRNCSMRKINFYLFFLRRNINFNFIFNFWLFIVLSKNYQKIYKNLPINGDYFHWKILLKICFILINILNSLIILLTIMIFSIRSYKFWFMIIFYRKSI